MNKSAWLQSRKTPLDGSPQGFVLLRQFQVMTQAFISFIHRKTRRIGCNFKEHATRFMKVDGFEIFPVDYRGYGKPTINQQSSPVLLFIVCRCSKGNVMNRTTTLPPVFSSRVDNHIKKMPESIVIFIVKR